MDYMELARMRREWMRERGCGCVWDEGGDVGGGGDGVRISFDFGRAPGS